MSRFILVHGSWHGAWCWTEVVPLLQKAGHEVTAVDLPGHGQDKTPAEQIKLGDYTDCVAKVLGEGLDPAVLVGHSMGGVVISQLAEKMWHEIKQLIFVCAFMPGHSRSMLSWAQEDKESLVLQNLSVEEPVLKLPLDASIKAFYHDCSPAVQKWAANQLVPDPLTPVTETLELSDAGYGQLHRHYIRCSQDRAITPFLQEEMLKNDPCESSTLDSSHSPFLSQPEELVASLLALDAKL
ncbi:MAG TPA: alpha/beta fold hydrolase [Actinomycetota bacterium]|nr:alpha/beta fold hydrolase [Actinomycetota bacterium]